MFECVFGFKKTPKQRLPQSSNTLTITCITPQGAERHCFKLRVSLEGLPSHVTRLLNFHIRIC